MQTLFAASSWPVARLRAFTIRLVHTCTLRTWTSLSILIATISRLGSSSRMGDRSHVWKGQFQAEPAALIPATTSGNRIRVAGSGTTNPACSRVAQLLSLRLDGLDQKVIELFLGP